MSFNILSYLIIPEQGLQANKLKEQLLYQLPPQDFNPTKRNSIKDVNDNDDENYFETNEFHLFRSIVQETAVGLANTKLFDENENNEMVIILRFNCRQNGLFQKKIWNPPVEDMEIYFQGAEWK